MQLSIKLDTKYNLEDFIYLFVIPEIQTQFLSFIDHNLTDKWNEYLINEYEWASGDTPKTVHNIICQGIQNLTCFKNGSLYIISIDPNINLQGTSAKLYDLCYMVNYGSLSMSPYPIFEDTFKKVNQLIPILIEEYLDFKEATN